MEQWKRQQFATPIFKALLGPFIKQIFGFSYEKIPLEGSYLLLCNHNMDYDPIFLGMAAGPLRYVASEHIMRKGLGTRFLKYFFDPITIAKGHTAARTTMDMYRSLKDGKPVCLFPEGNRSFNGVTGHIPEVTGKLAQKSGVPLVTYRLDGGYLTQPRWGTSIRRGRLRGSVVGIYTPEELKAMKPAAITEMIRRDLHADAYEAKAERIPHQGKNPALGLETAIFCCPACHKFGTLHSDAHHLMCDCGLTLRYDEYGYLNQGDRSWTITELDQLQREALAMKQGTVPCFTDRVTVQEIGPDHAVLHEFSGLLEADPEHIRFEGREYPLSAIGGVAVHSRNGLTVHFGEENKHLEIMGDRFWNALKYLYLYNLVKGKEMF